MAEAAMTEPTQKAVAEEFDRYRDRYSATVNEALIVPGLDVDYFTRVKADILLDHADRRMDGCASLSVLDIGCGVGNYHSLLDGRFSRLIGIDVSEESVAKARETHPGVEYHAYDGARLPFADETFDLAFAICVVHHVPVPAWPDFFSEMRRVLRRGGHALIFEHNPRNPLTMRVINRCPFDKDAVLIVPSRTRELLSGAGFRDVSTRTFLSMPRVGPVTNRLDDMFGRLPFGAQYLGIGVK